MAEATQIVFTHKEVVEALLKKQGITDGIWGLYILFGIAAANVQNPTPPEATHSDLNPAAIVPVLSIGLQKFEEEGKLSVDASKLNLKTAKSKKKLGTKH